MQFVQYPQFYYQGVLGLDLAVVTPVILTRPIAIIVEHMVLNITKPDMRAALMAQTAVVDMVWVQALLGFTVFKALMVLGQVMVSMVQTGYGVNGATGYGAGAGTVLGGAAPYGTAVGGAGTAGQYASGQYTNDQCCVSNADNGVAYGTSNQFATVQGAPIYVPQPYPAYYGVATGGGYNYGGGLRGGAAALPFGIEAGIGTNLAIGGDIFTAKPAGLALGSTTRSVGASEAISYGDAYKDTVSYDIAATYDVDPSTTVIGRVGYSNAEGNRVQVGNVTDTGFPGVDEPYFATWSDLEQVALEGGGSQIYRWME